MPYRNPAALLDSVIRAAAVVFVGVALVGCGSFDDIWGSEPPPPCPQVSVLKDAAVVTRFREGGGRDITDILHEGEVSGFSLTCEYDVDEDTGIGFMRTEISLQITASRGAADRERAATFSYFVALTDQNREGVAKKVFQTVIEFPGNLTVVDVVDEPVGLSIPISPQRSIGDYLIFVGFQLTKDEITYNRQQEGFR